MQLFDILSEATSHWISSLDYKEETSDVIMNTVYGKQYEINDVPREVYDEWTNASSAGTYFHEHIKNNYLII